MKSNFEIINTEKMQFLKSYNIIVGVFKNGIYYVTDEWYSTTTTKHIKKWLDGKIPKHMPQKFFNTLYNLFEDVITIN